MHFASAAVGPCKILRRPTIKGHGSEMRMLWRHGGDCVATLAWVQVTTGCMPLTVTRGRCCSRASRWQACDATTRPSRPRAACTSPVTLAWSHLTSAGRQWRRHRLRRRCRPRLLQSHWPRCRRRHSLYHLHRRRRFHCRSHQRIRIRTCHRPQHRLHRRPMRLSRDEGARLLQWPWYCSHAPFWVELRCRGTVRPCGTVR
jgi:hypothetical protein